jgi:aryl-alcohol dehydrogenase-like predicted oxidoreductase
VGVINYSQEDMIKMQEELSKYNIPLAVNQCEFSVLRRLPETSGLLQACKERGIVFQSYGSLAQGGLTGKYTADNQPPKEYRLSSYDMKEIEPVNAVLQKVSTKHNVKIVAVALNYNTFKGTTTVVDLRKVEQTKNNCAALGWRLSDDEIRKKSIVSVFRVIPRHYGSRVRWLPWLSKMNEIFDQAMMRI